MTPMPDATQQLFLISPILTGAPGETDALDAALGAGPVACVLLRHGARDERAAKTLLRDLVRRVQAAGAAALVQGDPRLVAYLDADGLQVDGPGDALSAALGSLKPERIVGCGALLSRDDAMAAGEGDVDYLIFGEPDASGESPDAAAVQERVGWWAEIFNVPCVGVAQTLDAVEGLAAAGAEFIGLGAAVFADPRGPAAAVTDAVAAIRAAAALAPAR